MNAERLEYLAARGDVDARRELDRLRPRVDPSAILINPDLDAWTMRDGFGYGDGSGSGNGNGYGDGDGDGDGYGYSSGSGNGDGDGSGEPFPGFIKTKRVHHEIKG